MCTGKPYLMQWLLIWEWMIIFWLLIRQLVTCKVQITSANQIRVLSSVLCDCLQLSVKGC